jgi:hypothetical protein
MVFIVINTLVWLTPFWTLHQRHIRGLERMKFLEDPCGNSQLLPFVAILMIVTAPASYLSYFLTNQHRNRIYLYLLVIWLIMLVYGMFLTVIRLSP